MKKTAIIIVSILLKIVLFSCTPQAIPTEGKDTQACCGDDIYFPPPPNGGYGED